MVETLSDDKFIFGIVKKIASKVGVEPLDLPPLQESIDTHALASLIEDSDSDSIFVKFEHYDHVVTVDSTGHVEVEEKSCVEC